MKLRFCLFALIFSACASKPQHEPHEQMRSVMFQPDSLRFDSNVKKLISADVPENHATDWTIVPADDFAPLKGLRIALDPGHVGGVPWDERNGKYIYDSNQNRLSEGALALELAELLAIRLRKNGAEVFLDRTEKKPVTAHDFNDFEMFRPIYFQRLDLDARAEKILTFNPDVTLILHFDSHMPGPDLNINNSKDLCNDTKSYVPGNFEEGDFRSEEDQAFFHIVWNSPKAWQDSLDLSRAITTQIHNDLGIPFDVAPHDHQRQIEPGIYARNLRLQRRLAGHVSSYVETLCYEDHGEFVKLKENRKRLEQLAEAIAKGVKTFVRARATVPVAYP